jgi:hypothetical protein
VDICHYSDGQTQSHPIENTAAPSAVWLDAQPSCPHGQAAPVNCAMPTDADRTGDYKGFTIRTFKTPNGLWRAIITKADGGKIKAAGQNESFDMIPIQLDSLDREKAFEEAKRLIDAGSMT